ncbi:MAG: VCBS repeat-containing protein [Phycisphaerae bacterium]
MQPDCEDCSSTVCCCPRPCYNEIGVPLKLRLADIDGDGNLDAVMVASNRPSFFYVIRGNGQGGFGDPPVRVDNGIGGGNLDLDVFDLNCDRLAEVVLAAGPAG